MPNETLDLDAIEARANAATPGPWYFNPRCPWELRSADIVGIAVVTPERVRARRTADFIAAARTDVPALVARVRDLETENARLRRDEARVDAALAVYADPDAPYLNALTTDDLVSRYYLAVHEALTDA